MSSEAGVWFVFFFFKQKTAYEIKECDWSSDVCSSDLQNQLFGTEEVVSVKNMLSPLHPGV